MTYGRKDYIKNIKKIFPVYGKKEKQFLRKLIETINNEMDEAASYYECRDRLANLRKLLRIIMNQ